MLPVTDRAVYGGMLAADRIRARQQLRKREAAQREREAALIEAQRRDGRNSERRRRLTGKAPTTAERYALDPEPFKASAASYYAAHAEEVKAKRRARYERDKDAVNAKARERHAARRSAAA
jgi:hypothetical protein